MNKDDWREQQKAKRRELTAQRREARKTDPRALAQKKAAKERRHEIYVEQKRRHKERAQAQTRVERGRSDEALLQLVRPASPGDE